MSNKTDNAAKHTPGPWHAWEIAIPFSGFEISRIEPKGFGVGIARVAGKSPEIRANANLIAEAPALLNRVLKLRDGLQWIADQGCQPETRHMNAQYSCKNHPSNLCITEYCLPCYAAVVLAEDGGGEQ